MTEVVVAGDEGGRLQVPQLQFFVIATADHPLTVRRNRNAQDILSVATWDNSIGECAFE